MIQQTNNKIKRQIQWGCAITMSFMSVHYVFCLSYKMNGFGENRIQWKTLSRIGMRFYFNEVYELLSHHQRNHIIQQIMLIYSTIISHLSINNASNNVMMCNQTSPFKIIKFYIRLCSLCSCHPNIILFITIASSEVKGRVNASTF